MPLVSFPVTKISQSQAMHRPGGHQAERSPRKPHEEAWLLPLDHQIRTPLLPSTGRLWNRTWPHPHKLNSPQKVVRMSEICRRLFIPSSFPPASSPGFTLRAQISAISLAVEPCLSLVHSSQEACEDEPYGSHRGTQSLSSLLLCNFVVSDTEYFCNSLFLEDVFLGLLLFGKHYYSSKFI